MTNEFDVVVIGGGIMGLSTAVAMRQRHFSVALIDTGALDLEACNKSRVYALNRASQALLQTLGVWPLIEDSSVPYRHMHVWDAATHAHIDFDARMIGCNQLGVIVDEARIKEYLLAQARVLQVALMPHNRIHSIKQDGMHQLLNTNGTLLRSRLLMVADGAQSATKELLNVSTTSWPYHQHAITATVSTEKPHQNTAYQIFTPHGPLAFLPLQDVCQCSIVWSSSINYAQMLMALSDDAFSQQLTQAFEAKLGTVRVQSIRQKFPLHMRHSTRYSGNNWLILGDAAHTIHPLAGLGLNLGLADLTSFLQLLDKEPHCRWSQKTLRAYQRQRKYAVWQTIALMQGLKTLFSHPFPPIATLRGMGLHVCNHLPLLKRLLIEHAAG
jgi:2-octaprenylphenol hydroxylase